MKKVIVIGAGILGASTAYELVKNGAQVTIIDREDVGQATKAAAGIICPWNSQRRNKKWYRLAKDGARYYPTLVKELKQYTNLDIGYKKVGALSLHSDETKLLAMKERTLKRKVDAPEIGELSILSQQEVKERFPLVANGYGALFIEGAARVDGWALRQAILEASQKLGARFLTCDCSLFMSNHKIAGVITEKEIIHADEVIITAGVWANELLHPLQLTLDLRGQKGQIIHLQMPNLQTSHWPVIMPPHDQYLLTLEDNRIVIGATHENETELNANITVRGIQEILAKALHFAPALEDSIFLEARVGFRPFTADFLPVFGRPQNINGLLLANGLGASGLTVGPFLGQQLATYCLFNKMNIPMDEYSIHPFLKKVAK